MVTPADALTLIQNAPVEDRALWGTACYAGLRRGELQALGWDAVDRAPRSRSHCLRRSVAKQSSWSPKSQC
jgi:integrase